MHVFMLKLLFEKWYYIDAASYRRNISAYGHGIVTYMQLLY